MAPYGMNLMKAFRLDEPKKTLSTPRKRERFCFSNIFIKFAIQGAVLLTASAVLSFYFLLRSN